MPLPQKSQFDLLCILGNQKSVKNKNGVLKSIVILNLVHFVSEIIINQFRNESSFNISKSLYISLLLWLFY